MKHGTRRRDTLPDVAVSLNWRAPSAEGGGEPREAEEQPATVERLKVTVTPRDDTPGEGAGEPVKVSGLTAEGLEAGCAGVTAFHSTAYAEAFMDRTGGWRFWVVKADASGLAAEGVEAGATSTTPAVDGDDPTSREPGAGLFDQRRARGCQCERSA